MTFSTPFHVPGAFHAEGVHPGLFRPPVSMPSPSSEYIPSIESLSKRKRNHEDMSRSHTSDAVDANANAFLDPYYGGASPAAATPALRSYVLAGQLDTPSGGPSDHGILGESVYSDSDYRRALGSKRPRGDEMDVDQPGPMPLFNLPPEPRPVQTWSSVAFATLGGVVGRVWDFCRTSAFKGFYAGGGKGFDVHTDAHPPAMDFSPHEKETHQVSPGQFSPGDVCASNYTQDEAYGHHHHNNNHNNSGASTPTKPAVKRRQTDQSDDLGRNWVIVNELSRTEKPARRPSLQPSSRNRNHAPSVTTGRRKSTPAARLPAPNPPQRRPVSRLSNVNPITIQPPRPASSASYASPRSPSPSKIPRLAATPTHVSSPSTPSSNPRRRASLLPSASLSSSFSHRRSQSAASAATSRASFHEVSPKHVDVDASPRLDPEAKQLAARRRLEERDADVRMAAFNKRLQDMIRQGKEALGTTVEVDGGEGLWEDDE